MPHRLYLETFGPVHALPVLHYTMEFAHLVRQAVAKLQPDCIAIELPPTLAARFVQGVRRLPQISVISYQVPGNDDGEETVYLLIEPADPLVEAARLALEQEIPLQLVDVDVDHYPAHTDPLPDSYAIQRIGLGPYYQEFVRAAGNAEPDLVDQRREQGMAFRLQELSRQHDRILFVGGMGCCDEQQHVGNQHGRVNARTPSHGHHSHSRTNRRAGDFGR